MSERVINMSKETINKEIAQAVGSKLFNNRGSFSLEQFIQMVESAIVKADMRNRVSKSGQAELAAEDPAPADAAAINTSEGTAFKTKENKDGKKSY